jgi:hypothetical protein
MNACGLRSDRYVGRPGRVNAMTVEEFITKLRLMPRGAELLALEPGCKE